jgi:hypothetical protein
MYRVPIYTDSYGNPTFNTSYQPADIPKYPSIPSVVEVRQIAHKLTNS